jgi:hypothetical protein
MTATRPHIALLSVRRAVLALAVAVGALLLPGLAGPAAAGGPTSVLLVAPESGASAALHLTDPAYGELARLIGVSQLGVAEAPGADESQASEAAPGRLPAVTATWLIHDVQVWRVDRITMASAERVQIATELRSEGSAEAPTSSHRELRAADSAELTALLRQLGLWPALGGPVGGPAPAAAAVPDASAEAAAAAVAGPGDVVTADDTERSAVRWALGGLAVGLLAGAAGSLTVTTRRSRESSRARRTTSADGVGDEASTSWGEPEVLRS